MDKKIIGVGIIAICIVAGVFVFSERSAVPTPANAPAAETVATTSSATATSAATQPVIIQASNAAPVGPGPTGAATSSPAVAASQITGPVITLTVGSTTYESSATTSETVLALMQQLASTTSFTFTGHNDIGLGFFVDSIDGIASANGLYWFLYVNGSSSQLGASSQVVSPGDSVEWRYEKSSD